jgi:hypothetical protein
MPAVYYRGSNEPGLVTQFKWPDNTIPIIVKLFFLSNQEAISQLIFNLKTT